MNEKQLPPDISPAVEAPVAAAADWRRLAWLPCKLSLELPMAHFTVRELLSLTPGKLVTTGWSRGAEIPLRANGELIGWAEFEPVGEHIGVRITELNASTAMLQQLQQQQASVSGVSLDEEASNLLLYQRAYQAAAHAISTVDQMLQVAIQMGSGT